MLSRIEFRMDHTADNSLAYGGTEVGDPTKSSNYILLASFAQILSLSH